MLKFAKGILLLILLSILATIYAIVANAEVSDYTSCRYIEDTEKFLECVEEQEFIDQYSKPPDTDIIKEDYQDEVKEVDLFETIDGAIDSSVQENLDAESNG